MKPKTCKICKEKFEPKNKFQLVCSYQCANEYAKIHLKKEAINKWNKEKKVIKEKLKTLTEYENEAKQVFQKWVRLRDKDLPCISCGTPTSPIWDGGHYLKAEIYSGMIFNENNVHKQCRKCNHFLGGNELNYRRGLFMRFDKKFIDDLEALGNEKRNYKYTKEELIDIKNIYKEKIKQFNK